MILSAYCQINNIEEGLKAIELFKEEGYSFDENASQSTLVIYTRNNQSDEALALFSEFFKNPGSESLKIPATWGNIIKMLVNNRRFKEAAQIYEQMKEYGTERNMKVFTLSLTLYRHLGEYEKAFEEFQELNVLGMQPNLQIYSCMFTLCRNAENYEFAESLYERALKENIELNTLALTPLIHMRMATKNFEGANDLLKLIKRKYPNEFEKDIRIQKIKAKLRSLAKLDV
jgi:pentatricopeptide repeat protein